jgi:glycyl-tRNA synthetase beta chain
MSTQDLLIELGTEELPPKALLQLSEAFTQGVVAGLAEHRLQHGNVQSYASPRRLAVVFENLQSQAEDQAVEALGPPADRAKDEEGNWSKAAVGFAKKHGIDPDTLEIAETEKGPRLRYSSIAAGATVEDCLQGIIETSVGKLPIPKRMRWGAGRTEFVRPAHWAVVLFGTSVLPCTILGHSAGRTTQGHRFHSTGEIEIAEPADYRETLRQAHVIADYAERQNLIKEQVEAEAAQLNATAVLDQDLLDEVTGLVEWPVALTGKFEKSFLQVPAEALVYSMKEHQKYFPVVDQQGQLLPNFITVSNIESSDPQQVVSGNERVIRPRLSDADFFFTTDKKTPLADRVDKLKDIVFQKKLGTLHDKTIRVAGLAQNIAEKTGADSNLAERAALLSKTDLLTEMVGEFADMQGIAGRYYALHDGEDASVAHALEQQYWPRQSGAQLPEGPVATSLALADRLDTLVGIFGIGQSPSGSKDPFALRRASLGVLRILVEGELDLDLRECLTMAAQQYTANIIEEDTVEKVLSYMIDRFRAWYEDEQIAVEVFKAVAARELSQPLDIHHRVRAVDAFSRLPEARALAAANKRVSNILDGKSTEIEGHTVSEPLLQEPAEQQLAAAIAAKHEQASALFNAGEYTALLASLADLQGPVDTFFDEVMVMADDEAVRKNRLCLLNDLRELFLQVADISQLAVTK